MDIRKLDSDVTSKIRSSFSINSVAQCVFELVCNSLDAKSTSVAVRLNLVTFKIQVADNGNGITKENMELLGVRYTTNKCRRLIDLEKNLKTYGFRGEAIASIVEMCKSVSISSRSKTSSETYTRILSKEFGSKLKLSKHRASVGTTVTVLGWLSPVPVRQQMIVQEVELEKVKNQLENLVIINPGTSFTLRNDVTGLLILNSPKCPDIVDSFRQLHPEVNDSFTLLKVSKNKVSIEMLIQKELFLAKKLQYIYVNKRPVKSSKIRQHVLKAFSKKDSLESKKSLLFNTKKYPVYVMNIKCPPFYVDNLMTPSKTEVEFTCWELVLACVDKIMKTFLGVTENNEKIPVQGKADDKLSFGVSQLFGAVQASAFKRKSDDNQSEEDDHNIGKIRRVEDEGSLKTKETDEVRHSKGFVIDKTVTSNCASENYDIEYSNKQQQPIKPLKIKSIVKKPLAIKVKSNKMFEQGSVFGKENCLRDGVDDEDCNNKQLFDQRSVYSRLHVDENCGKDLIMDMFLKSTQVFKESDDILEAAVVDVSKETIEESNFLFENNVQDAVKGVNTTMSISVNVKRRRLKNLNNKISKYVQTADVDSKLTSKYVQTSHEKIGGDDFQRCNFYSNDQEAPVPIVGDKKIENLTSKRLHDFSSKIDQYLLKPNQQMEKNTFIDHKKSIPKSQEKPLIIRRRNLLTASRFQPPHKQYVCKGIPEIACAKQEIPAPIPEHKNPKCIQTNLGFSRQKSCQTDLATRLEGFTLGPDNKESMKNDYTILINTVHKKREYVFVRKSEDEIEVDENRECMDYKPLKICHCDEEDESIFRFRKEEGNGLLSVKGRKGTPITVSTEFREGKHENQRATGFRVPPSYISKPKMSSRTSVLNMNNLYFRGMTNHPPLKPQTNHLCSQSPYFLKNRNVGFGVDHASGHYEPSAFETFQPMFKSTQISRDKFQQAFENINDVRSPFFAKNYPAFLRTNNFKNANENLRSYCVEFAGNTNNRVDNSDIMDAVSRVNHHYCQNRNIYLGQDFIGQPKILENRNVKSPFDECHPRNACKNSKTSEGFCGNMNNLHINFPDYHLQRKEMRLIDNLYKKFNPMKTNNRFFKHVIDRKENNNFLINNKAESVRLELNKNQTHLKNYYKCCQDNDHKELMNQTNILFQNNRQFNEQNVDGNCQVIDLIDPPGYTPVVSNEKFHFETEIEIVNTKTEKPEGTMFNFKPSCSPNIFTDEVAQTGSRITKDVDENMNQAEQAKHTDKVEKMNLSTLCDLADFGLVDLKKTPTPKDESRLEISFAANKERHNLVEKELLKLQSDYRINLFTSDSEMKSIDEGSIEQKLCERSRIIVDSQNEWLRRVNEDGRKFFVNKRTGMVTAKTPDIPQNKFDFDKRLDFVPKGMSPVLKEHKKIDKTLSQNAKTKLHDLILEGYDDELMVIKWQNFIGDDPKTFFGEIYREKTKQFESCIPSVHENHFKIPVNFISFTNQLFGNIDLIGQVDKKFIAVREMSKNLLILFDQHAVHERIRVEKFLDEYEGLKTPCKEKLTIFMPHVDLGLFKKHSTYVNSMGLGVEFFSNGIHVTEMPLCIKDKFNDKGNCEDLNTILNMLVKDIVELLKVTGNLTSKLMPKMIQNIINLKACRGAVKFGDVLSMQECRNLLKDLSKCKLPFQCAHGRPTLTPILSLNKIQPKAKVYTKKIDFKTLFSANIF